MIIANYSPVNPVIKRFYDRLINSGEDRNGWNNSSSFIL